jgi:TolA-binding protein
MTVRTARIAGTSNWGLRFVGLGGAALALLAIAPPALAQDGNDEARVRKLEAEVRALQRRVFPGGDGRYFEPEITGQPQTSITVAQPSTTAVTDILARLDAMETQIQRLTGQTEQNTFALRTLGERLDALEAGAVLGTATTTGSGGAPARAPAASVAPGNASSTTATPTPSPATVGSTPSPATVAPDPERLAAVSAIAKPQTEDPADDEYSYGFRLWEAGFYPEAQQQLTLFVEQNPQHWRATYGRNLLGRAYLDDSKPREAAPWFLRNYQADKAAARAGDSLLFLAEAMIALDDTSRACIALAEFAETYPALAAGRLLDQYERNRARVTCN